MHFRWMDLLGLSHPFEHQHQCAAHSGHVDRLESRIQNQNRGLHQRRASKPWQRIALLEFYSGRGTASRDRDDWPGPQYVFVAMVHCFLKSMSFFPSHEAGRLLGLLNHLIRCWALRRGLSRFRVRWRERPPSCDHSRYGQSNYALRARVFQGSRAGIEGGACRTYVIYQQDAEVVNLRAAAHFVSATDRLPALAPGKQEPWRSRFRPHEQVSAQRESQSSGERPGDQFCLIVAAFTPARRVQRNGHYHVSREDFRLGAYFFFQSSREPMAESRQFLVFQETDRSGHLVAVISIAASAIESIDPSPAGEAQWRCGLGRNFRNERPATKCATWAAQRRERGEALLANRQKARRSEDVTADAARRGENHRDKRVHY